MERRGANALPIHIIVKCRNCNCLFRRWRRIYHLTVISDGIRALYHAIIGIQIKPMGAHARFGGIGRHIDGKDAGFSVLVLSLIHI